MIYVVVFEQLFLISLLDWIECNIKTGIHATFLLPNYLEFIHNTPLICILWLSVYHWKIPNLFSVLLGYLYEVRWSLTFFNPIPSSDVPFVPPEVWNQILLNPPRGPSDFIHECPFKYLIIVTDKTEKILTIWKFPKARQRQTHFEEKNM